VGHSQRTSLLLVADIPVRVVEGELCVDDLPFLLVEDRNCRVKI
jgi:hypothetical protein